MEDNRSKEKENAGRRRVISNLKWLRDRSVPKTSLTKKKKGRRVEKDTGEKAEVTASKAESKSPRGGV